MTVNGRLVLSGTFLSHANALLNEWDIVVEIVIYDNFPLELCRWIATEHKAQFSSGFIVRTEKKLELNNPKKISLELI